MPDIPGLLSREGRALRTKLFDERIRQCISENTLRFPIAVIYCPATSTLCGSVYHFDPGSFGDSLEGHFGRALPLRMLVLEVSTGRAIQWDLTKAKWESWCRKEGRTA